MPVQRMRFLVCHVSILIYQTQMERRTRLAVAGVVSCSYNKWTGRAGIKKDGDVRRQLIKLAPYTKTRQSQKSRENSYSQATSTSPLPTASPISSADTCPSHEATPLIHIPHQIRE